MACMFTSRLASYAVTRRHKILQPACRISLFSELVAAHLTSNVGGLFLEIGSRKFSSAPSSRSRSSSSSLSADSSLYSTNLSSWVCPKKRAWTRDCSISGVARSFVAMFCSVPFACDEDTPNLCSVECGAFSASLSCFCLSLALSLWIKQSSWCISM